MIIMNEDYITLAEGSGGTEMEKLIKSLDPLKGLSCLLSLEI